MLLVTRGPRLHLVAGEHRPRTAPLAVLHRSALGASGDGGPAAVVCQQRPLVAVAVGGRPDREEPLKRCIRAGQFGKSYTLSRGSLLCGIAYIGGIINATSCIL